MSTFPEGTRVRVVSYGGDANENDADFVGREGTVIEAEYDHYISVNLDGAEYGTIDSLLPCMAKELEII